MRHTLELVLISAVACARPNTSARQPTSPVDTARTAFNPKMIYMESIVGERPTINPCPPLAYQDTLRQAGIEGRVIIMRLVIDTLGRPEPGSVQAVRSPPDSLASVAVRAILACEFTPGRVRGRAVRVLIVRQRDFRFDSL